MASPLDLCSQYINQTDSFSQPCRSTREIQMARGNLGAHYLERRKRHQMRSTVTLCMRSAVLGRGRTCYTHATQAQMPTVLTLPGPLMESTWSWPEAIVI